MNPSAKMQSRATIQTWDVESKAIFGNRADQADGIHIVKRIHSSVAHFQQQWCGNFGFLQQIMRNIQRFALAQSHRWHASRWARRQWIQQEAAQTIKRPLIYHIRQRCTGHGWTIGHGMTSHTANTAVKFFSANYRRLIRNNTLKIHRLQRH